MAKATNVVKSKHMTIDEKVEQLESVMEAYVNNVYKYGKSIEQLEIAVGQIKANMSAPNDDEYEADSLEYDQLIKDVQRLKSKMGM